MRLRVGQAEPETAELEAARVVHRQQVQALLLELHAQAGLALGDVGRLHHLAGRRRDPAAKFHPFVPRLLSEVRPQNRENGCRHRPGLALAHQRQDPLHVVAAFPDTAAPRRTG